MRRACGIIALGMACCRVSPRPPEAAAPVDPVLVALSRMEMLLEGGGVRVPHIEKGRGPYRAVLASIRASEVPPEPLPAEGARQRVAAADVVLVADSHHLDLCRVAFRRIVEDLSEPAALRQGRVAIALEAIPTLFEAQIFRQRARGERGPLVRSLQQCWGWPIERYADLLLRPRLRSAPLLAVGGVTAAAMSPTNTPDAKRIPPLASWDEIKRAGSAFSFKNELTAKRLEQWLEDSGDQVFVLYGAWHLGGIRKLLSERGLESVILVPFLPDWELALRERLGRGTEGRWFELDPGVFRAPYVSGSEISPR